MNKTTLNSQKEKHSMLSLRRATYWATRARAAQLNFYPRSPYGERRRCGCCLRWPKGVFLSTLSLRRATADGQHVVSYHENFYPRSPYGERLIALLCRHSHPHFYPRSPYGERQGPVRCTVHAGKFLSTLSLRRATRLLLLLLRWWRKFLSTLSLRRATHLIAQAVKKLGISIHALLTESDLGIIAFAAWLAISIHALLTESDRQSWQAACTHTGFLSTLSLRRATIQRYPPPRRDKIFLSTLSLRRATLQFA